MTSFYTPAPVLLLVLRKSVCLGREMDKEFRRLFYRSAATAQWFVTFLSTWEEAEKDQLLMLMPF